MSRGQWTVDLSGAGTASYPSPGLVGSSALQVTPAGVGSLDADITVTPASGLPHGLTAGRLRALFKATGEMNATRPNILALFWMAQQPAVIGTLSVTCYGVVVEYDRLTLRKVLGINSLGSGDILATAPQGYVLGTLLSLQAQWEIVNTTQVRMQVWRGTTPTYTNLSRVIDYTDTAPDALLTSVWEGVSCRQQSATAEVFQVTIDSVGLYRKS